jgi:hypothetical protein
VTNLLATWRTDADLAGLCRAACDDSLVVQNWRFRGREAYRLPRARHGLAWVLAQSGVGPGDEVLIPDLEHLSMPRAALSVGALPVAYGVAIGDLAPSLEWCVAGVTNRTRAVVVPHLYGFYTHLAGFRELADRHGLLLIEDSAHLISDVEVPPLEHDAADCALYSFDYDKPLSVGWGGALALSERLRGRVGAPAFETLSVERDRTYAAAFLVQHCLSDAAVLAERFFLSTDVLTRVERGGPGLVEEILRAAGEDEPAPALLEWCGRRLPAR